MQTDNFQLLIQKLDEFIRKYYINQLIRGSLYFLGLVLGLYLLFAILEYYAYFPQGVRKAFFYSFLLTTAIAFWYWILTPAIKYFRLGPVISHEQAASIIGDHFGDVKDRLLNILQLNRQAENSSASRDLIIASINQKSDQIKFVPFKTAIDLRSNRKYAKYALPPLVLFLFLLFAAPSVLKEGTNRIIHNDESFERAAPFEFIVEENNLKVVQYEDFTIHVHTQGDIAPNDAYVEIDGFKYHMEKTATGHFKYTFKNVQKDIDFRCLAANVTSSDHLLDVLEKPNILGFTAYLNYPNYTGRNDEQLSNLGDLNVPVGTQVKWIYDAQHTQDLNIKFNTKTEAAERQGRDRFIYKKRILTDAMMTLYLGNVNIPRPDSITYSINVIPDLHPAISVKKFQDSTQSEIIYFAGDASDDYGLTKLSLQYTIKKNNSPQTVAETRSVAISSGKASEFEYILDLQSLGLQPGDGLEYYFEVFDNDAVHGAKSTKSQLFSFALPSLEELKEQEETNEEDIKKELEDSVKKTKELQKEIKRLREKMLQEKDIDWQQKKELEKIIEKQQSLEESVQQAKEKFEENIKNQEQFSEKNEELIEKQEKLQEMFEEVLDDEMKKLLEDIQELLEELNKEDALEKMEDMEMSDEEMEKELDRLEEMFKDLEVEKEMQEQLDKLDELAEKQEKLSEDTKEDRKSEEQLNKEQEELNKEFEEWQEDQKDLEEKNEALETPKDLDADKEEIEDIQEDMEDAKEALDEKNKSGASKKQKSASEKMKQMANNMKMEMQSGQQEQLELDMKALRQLLENLVELSHEQERLMQDFSHTTINTPRYKALTQEQFKLKDDFSMIDDSLHALSKRVVQIESYVTEKTTDINQNIAKSIDELEERRVPNAQRHQQFTMTYVNDLALMLSETMEQMQQQMSSMMQGNQMCNNPGDKPGKGKGKKPGSKPGDKMSKGQQSLGESLKELNERLKKGEGKLSKEFAQAAARQAALRKALRELQKEKQEQGKGSKELESIIDQMDKLETDLVNKRLNNETLKRQETILTRLLEAEKAERQRDKDDKRKSENAQQIERQIPPELEQYLKDRKSEVDQLKTVSPYLKPYYKTLVEDYLNDLKQ